MILKFDDTFAQAWFRTRLHRASALADNVTDETTLLGIRAKSHGTYTILTDSEAQMALNACENKVGKEPGSMEARQRIVDQLREGLR